MGDPRDGRDVDVLVVGAGPTGLTAACEAISHGLTVEIIDRKPCRSTFSKALVAHARTLEVFETMGIAEAVLAQGARFAALNTHFGRRRAAVRVDLLALDWGDTAYPFWLSIPQYATEQILETRLDELGGRVRWRTSLERIHERGDHVEATLTDADGRSSTVRSRWLVGCDGGRSRVRDEVGLRLERTDAGATFVLADVKTTASLTEDEGHVFLGPDGLLLIVPMPGPRLWRIIAHVPQASGDAVTIDAAFLDELIRRRSGIEFGSHEVAWQSQFQLSHGLVDHYRRGRIFLAGDAAHVHSPVGGQGLNTGVQDAHNLLWKLAAVQRLDPVRAERLLDSYEAERRTVGQAMVRGTALATGALTTRNAMVRTLLGVAAPRVIARPAVRARLGRPVGMLEVAYGRRARPGLRPGTAGVGRRMPNPMLRTGERLYRRLDRTGYTWVVWGQPGQAPPDPDEPRWHGLPTVFLTDQDLAEPPRLRIPEPDRVVLVRPDRYIAAVEDAPATRVGSPADR